MKAWKYVILIAILSVAGVIAITFIAILQPTQNNTLVIATIVGFLMPTVTTIVAVMVKDIHQDINSRMTELINSTRNQALAEGNLEGKAKEKADQLAAQPIPVSVVNTPTVRVDRRNEP